MRHKELSVFALTLLLMTSAGVATTYAAGTQRYASKIDEQKERINALEAEIVELKEQQAKLAEEKERVSTKVPVNLYGFIDVQFIWGDSTVTTLGSTKDSFTAITDVANEAVVGRNDAFFGATPQNTRIGLDFRPTEISDGLSAGGRLELDFLNPSGGTSPRPRIRLAYGVLEGKRWKLVGGQEWDLFSPLNTATQQTASNLWFGGNLGCRRPQLKFIYSIPAGDKDGIALAASINNPGNFDTILNSTNTSGFPYGEASVIYTHPMNEDTLIAALSGVVGRDHSAVRKITIWGLAASLRVPVHKFFKPSGEFHYGVDLADFLSNCGLGARRRVIAGWGQITSQWHRKFQTNLGYGVESLKSDQIATGAVGTNQFGFANLWFNPVKPFGIGLEYDHIRTWYKDFGVSPANIVMLSTKFDF